MAIKAKCHGEFVRCFQPASLTMYRHVAVRRLGVPLNPTMLTWQGCHVFQVLFVAPVLELGIIHVM